MWSSRAARGTVRQLDEARRTRRPLADADQPAEALGRQLVLVAYPGREASGRTGADRLRGQPLRRLLPRGGVGQVPREVHRAGRHLAATNLGGERVGGVAGPAAGQVHPLRSGRFLVAGLRGGPPGYGVGGQRVPLDEPADPRAAAGRGEKAEHRTGTSGSARGGGTGSLQAHGRSVAEPDDQDGRGRDRVGGDEGDDRHLAG